jgi:TonB family protein
MLILPAFLFSAALSCSRLEQREGRIYTSEEEGVTAPKVLEAPSPSYTEEARIARAEGIVTLNAVVRKDGRVDRFEVVNGLGYGLDESAIRTVATEWRFKPATYEGQPVDCRAHIEVAFRIY